MKQPLPSSLWAASPLPPADHRIHARLGCPGPGSRWPASLLRPVDHLIHARSGRPGPGRRWAASLLLLTLAACHRAPDAAWRGGEDPDRPTLVESITAGEAGTPTCPIAELPYREGEPQPQIKTGVDELVAGELYVVYSAAHRPQAPGVPTSVSNIFVLRGRPAGGRTPVFLFGSGHGDPGGDHLAYKLGRSDAMVSAAHDAARVAEVIEQCFGVAPSLARGRFITPHGHLDHLNQEIFTALAAEGIDVETIMLHANDLHIATCNEACCGAAPAGDPACDDPQDPFMGAPFDPPWQSHWLARFRSVGGAPEEVPCETSLARFRTGGLGIWRVVWNDAHTGGMLDIHSDLSEPLSFYLRGGRAGCEAQHSRYDVAPYVHRNVVVP